MPHRFHCEHLGRDLHCGAVAPDFAQTRLVRAAAPALPSAPTEFDFTGASLACLGGVYLNDRIGSCVPAGFLHSEGIMTGLAGTGKPFGTDNDASRLYSTWAGYVPGKPETDRGCSVQAALNWWEQNPLLPGTSKILSYLFMDSSKSEFIKSAFFLWENQIYAGPLCDEWLVNLKPGNVWNVGTPNQNKRHCFIAGKGSVAGMWVYTWGMPVLITWAALAQLHSVGGECYSALTPDSINKAGKSQANITYDEQIAYFTAVGGVLVNPPPAPPAPPAPQQTTITLSQPLAAGTYTLSKSQ